MKARIVTLILGMAIAATLPTAAQDTLQTLSFRDAVKIGLKKECGAAHAAKQPDAVPCTEN